MSEVTELHEPFMSWLKSQDILYRRSRSDRATSETKGEPDFLIMETGRVLPIEFKNKNSGKLSKDQVFRHAQYARASCRVYVVRELSHAIELVNAWREHSPLAPTETSGEKLLRVFNAFYRETERGLERVKSAL